MLSTTFESSMVKVEEDIKVPATEKLQSRKHSLISTSETSVLAIKDFKVAYKCLSCKADDIQPRKTGSDALITCPTCSTSFLACKDPSLVSALCFCHVITSGIQLILE